jgi:transposase-like protein
MGELLASLRPGLVIADGEEELSGLAAEVFPNRPVQRCLWHLTRGTYRSARYADKASHELASDVVAALETLLTNAYRSHDLEGAQAAYAELIDDAEACGARAGVNTLPRYQGI